MAYTNAPQQSTYSTEMVPLLKELNNRDALGTKDNSFINVFFEIVKNEVTKENDYICIRRPGTSQLTPATGTGEIRGFFYWENKGVIVLAIGQGLYSFNVNTSVMTTINATQFTGSTGDVGFTEFQYEPVSATYGTSTLIFSDGVSLWQLSGTSTVTAATGAGLPATIVANSLVYFDGYIFCVKNGTTEIYNSVLNDPLTWSNTSPMTAESLPDTITKLAKLNNYMVAFGAQSIEYFWDAGNASGSPLQSNTTPIKYNGYLGGFAQLGNRAFFIGNTVEGEPCLFMLEDFKIVPINSQILRKYLAYQNVDLTTTPIKGNFISVVGHDFYVCNIGTETYVLELEGQLFTQWVFKSGTNFPMTFATNAKVPQGYKSIFCVSGDTKLYYFNQDSLDDAGTAFTWTIITDLQEFKTYQNKTMSRLIIWADKPPSSLPVSISWTDDDYQTYTTPISVDLFQEMSDIRRLGRFRRRAFKLSSSTSQVMRMYGLEVTINKGFS